MSRYIPAHVRFDVIYNSIGCCYICGTTVGGAHWEHVIPYKHVKEHHANNIRIACEECNLKKGARMPDLAINRSRFYQHQLASIDAIKNYPFETFALEGTDRQAAVLYHATSSGKTLTTLGVAFDGISERERKAGKKALIVVPNEITAQRFDQDYQNLRSSHFAGTNCPTSITTLTGSSPPAQLSWALKQCPVIVMTIQYLLNRVDDCICGRLESVRELVDSVEFLLIDEGHHVSVAGVWRKIVDFFANSKVVYLTGTPKRNDNECLPLAPYEITETETGRTYRLMDVAEITGNYKTRYTLADAVRDKKTKRVDTKATIVKVDGTNILVDSGYNASNLDDLRRKSQREGERFNPFHSEDVILNTLRATKEILDLTKRDYAHLGKKLTAIIKAENRGAAANIVRIAHQDVGLNAVVYHGIDGASKPDAPKMTDKQMEENLRRFEDPNDPVDVCVQVGRLSEGYNNASICICVWLASCHSDVLMGQFNGRGLRLFERIAQEDHPPLKIIAPEVFPLSSMLQRYVEMANEMSFTVKDSEPGERPDTYETRPSAVITMAEWRMLNGSEWTELVARTQHDPLDDDPELTALRETMDEQTYDRVKEMLRDARGLPKPVKEHPALVSYDAAQAEYTRRLEEVDLHLYRQMGPIQASYGIPSGSSVVHTMVKSSCRTAVGEFYPGLKGGKSNRSQDVDQLLQFVTQDNLEAIKDRAMDILIEQAERHARSVPKGITSI